MHRTNLSKAGATVGSEGKRSPQRQRELAAAFEFYLRALTETCKETGVALHEAIGLNHQKGIRGFGGSVFYSRIFRVRMIARYLAVTEGGFMQDTIANACGISPAAVCLGLKRIEDLRDEPEIDDLLNTLASRLRASLPRHRHTDILARAAREQIGA